MIRQRDPAPRSARARFAQAAHRLHARIDAETRPVDELLVAGPVDRITFLLYRPHQVATVVVR